MEATQTYNYTPLSGTRTIRVLRLSGGTTDNIFAELIETNLDLSCPYEAISYVWGSADKTHILNLRGGSSIKITKSLYHALKDIRYSAIEDGPRYLWADGVCINQEDTDERSQQVGLMAEIYRSALKVITYVGQDTLDVKRGIKLAEKLVAAQEESRRSIFPASVNQSHAKHQIPDETDPAWLALRDFLGRTWYTRMWIIQESVLNKNGIIVCGRIDIPWDLFLKLSNMLAHSAHKEYIHITPFSEKQIGALNWMNELKDNYRKHREGIPLYRLLIGSRVFNCFDPKDHVFAVASLMEESCRIKPDYQKTICRVYIEAAEQIRKSCGLEILSYAGILKQQAIPSWVPDWSVYPEQIPIYQSLNGLLFGIPTHKYVPADLKTGKLHLSGCVFDRVVHIGGTLRRSFITGRLERYEWARKQCSLLTQYSQLIQSSTKYVGGGSILEAFWRTLILDLDPDKRSQHHHALPMSGAYFESYVRPNKMWARDEALASLEEYEPHHSPKLPETQPEVMEAWKRESRLDPTECSKDQGTDNIFRSLRQKDPQWQGSRGEGFKYRDLVLKAQNLYRAFFMTEKGYIGMSAQGLRVGDLVAFIPGARVPFLLRRREGPSTYSLVGDCYVHGLMNGEVVRDSYWNESPIILI